MKKDAPHAPTIAIIKIATIKLVVRAIKIIEIPKINAIIVAIEWALSISFHLNKASIPKKSSN